MSTPPDPKPRATLWDTLKAVGWSFFGVRKNSAYQEDLGKLNPLHIIVVAFAVVIAFVVGLIVFVRYVVAP